MEKKPQTKVKVVVRVRPALNTDVKACVKVVEKNKVQIVNHRNTDENLQYEFSSVFNETATQSDIFTECVEPLIKNTLLGQNVSIFAYGPTGAGKTHTMLGVMSDPGLIPRVLKSLFKTIEIEKGTDDAKENLPETTVSFSYLEIYNEKVQDLLLSGNQDLPIREDASHNIFVAGLTEKVIDSFETFKKSFEPAASNRTVAATKLNETSSRSHSILMLKVNRRLKNKVYRGKIYLIDLAGSEDNRRTGNKGIRLKESGAINKSLFVLGEVVDAINHNLPRVPYRNSKLTRLLQDSIGGSCHSVMITNVAPEQHYYYDTYCTLNFATKSKKIVNVTTTTVKQDSPPILVKPVAAVKPTKRRSLSQIPVANAKRSHTEQPLSASSSSTDLQASTSLPSSLMRLQKELESANLEKTKALQEALKTLRDVTASTRQVNELEQELRLLTSLTDGSTKLKSSQSTPVLPSVKRRSKRLSQVPSVSVQSPDIICPTPDLKKNPFTAQKLRDTTNLLNQHHLGKRDKRGKPKLKKVKDDGPSCSPLFPDSPLTKKAATKRRSSEDFEDTPIKKKTKAAAKKFNSQSFQFQRNADFLEVLNTSSVKELQQLQTVGVKRAKLIFEWRQVHGPLDFVEELKEIPGFTDKYIKNLLRSNLVTTAQTAE